MRKTGSWERISFVGYWWCFLCSALVGFLLCNCSSSQPAAKHSASENHPKTEGTLDTAGSPGTSGETSAVYKSKVRLEAGTIFLSPQGKQVVLAENDDEYKTHLFCGETTLGPYEWLSNEPIWGPAEALCVCSARNASEREVLIVNGVAHGPFNAVDWPPVFSEDGRTFACVVSQDDKKCVLVGNQLEPAVTYISDLQFQPGTAQVAYIASDEGRHRVVIGGKSGPVYGEIRGLTYLEGQKTYAYWANRGWDYYRHGGQWYHVVGADEGKPFPDDSASGEFILDKSGRCVAYTTATMDVARVVWNGVRGKDYDRVEGLVASADGKRIAYYVEDGFDRFVVIGTTEGRHYRGTVSRPFVMPDGSTFAYSVELSSSDRNMPPQEFLVVETEEQKQYRRVADIGSWMDGKTLAYRAYIGGQLARQDVYNSGSVSRAESLTDGQWCYVVGGIELAAAPDLGGVLTDASPGYATHGDPFTMGDRAYVLIDNKRITEIKLAGLPLFSPDRAHYAYMTKRETDIQLILDGKAGRAYKRIEAITFGPDGKTVAYRVREKSSCFVVVGEAEGDRFDDVSNPVFHDADTVVYYGFKKDGLDSVGTVFRIERKLKP